MKLTDDVKQRKQKHFKQYRTAKQKLPNKENLVRILHRGKPNDGLPIEFYNVFWPTIGELLVKCFNEAYERKEMSNSQRQGVITLIEKTGKDRTYFENWRPISLTNVDAKVASKVIATRIIKILPEIIHSNQIDRICFPPIHRGGS